MRRRASSFCKEFELHIFQPPLVKLRKEKKKIREGKLLRKKKENVDFYSVKTDSFQVKVLRKFRNEAEKNFTCFHRLF